jgi:hypothetical protein
MPQQPGGILEAVVSRFPKPFPIVRSAFIYIREEQGENKLSGHWVSVNDARNITGFIYLNNYKNIYFKYFRPCAFYKNQIDS